MHLNPSRLSTLPLAFACSMILRAAAMSSLCCGESPGRSICVITLTVAQLSRVLVLPASFHLTSCGKVGHVDNKRPATEHPARRCQPSGPLGDALINTRISSLCRFKQGVEAIRDTQPALLATR
ncbi:hypothetical protein K469DRAFT_90331 [Zopfia rhizophila CBS 207.26]|uniref:Secreted protein n=1 Tax=Zopfia rhizophila CBS 207.26 TaxID=1314779 RepID=A0A6A6E8Q2_9PEZI|nr:hypothetical protein K469DRAFT_90331 [Zopfia rhizophila CBS 207.26]